jgi:hypothetical protein
MGLSCKIVDLIWLNSAKQGDQPRPIRQVPIVKKKSLILLVGVLVQMFDAFGIESGSAPDNAVNFVTLCQQEFGKVGAILTSNACYQSFFHYPPRVSV